MLGKNDLKKRFWGGRGCMTAGPSPAFFDGLGHHRGAGNHGAGPAAIWSGKG
ncbi:MAG: hypothetical protein LBO65_00040 [Spirochaetaceae bacterium]|jgi:hypothetical protein|nr:hypothetical protein [Spirochaetaceae bacterium]